MFPLTVGVAVVGLGALGTLWQLVAALAALETFEDCDPQRGFLSLLFSFFFATSLTMGCSAAPPSRVEALVELSSLAGPFAVGFGR